MNKQTRTFHRLLSLLLVIGMLVAMLPQVALSASAATTPSGSLTDQNIGLSVKDSNGTWTADGTKITGQVAGKKWILGTSSQTTTLTITNKRSEDAVLSFQYTTNLNDGSVKIDGSSASNGEFKKTIESGKSVDVEVTSAKSTTVMTSVTITNISLVVEKSVKTTFMPAENGTYTVDGQQITKEYSNTQESTKAYELEAIPSNGSTFLGWYNLTTGKYLSTDAKVSLKIGEDSVIMPKFAAKGDAIFATGGQPFADLGEAVSYAEKNGETKITLVGDGTIRGNYTIPANITLLIPFDEAGTVYTTEPAYTTKEEAQKAYKTLTMASGASITVNGAISVGGKHFTSSNQQVCKPTGPFGWIKMEEGSTITLNQGANLYAWGYITGDGHITATSGSAVYEYFQITDWRGGSQTSDMVNNESKVFPFSQYYVQNIEAELTLLSGSIEYGYITVTVGSGKFYETSKSMSFPFVGETGLFCVENGGYFTKKYRPAEDRMTYAVSGQASMKSIAMSVELPLVSKIDIDSKNYVLPVNNNVDIVINSGTTTLTSDVALLPGSTVTVADGAELKVANGASLYVYDKAEWSSKYVWGSNGAGVHPVAYTPSGKPNRTSVTEAKIDVNGTLTASGSVYTTKTGAAIVSSAGTGKFEQQAAPGSADTTYQYDQNGTSYVSIPITPAKLRNADTTFTETANAAAGSTFLYDNGTWKQAASTVTVTFDPNEGTGTMEPQVVPASTDTALKANAFTREHYTFNGWNTAADGTGTAYPDGANINVDKNVTLYAQWKIDTYTVTWVDEDGSTLKKDEVPYGEMPSYGSEPTKAADAQYTYTFAGWDPKVVPAVENTTYKAVYSETVNQYTITWKNWDGEVLRSEKLDYGETPKYTGDNPTRPGDAEHSYVFAGWEPDIKTVTKDETYTATFTVKINTYTVTWVNYDGIELQKDENVEYGTKPEFRGDTPTRPDTAEFTYAFSGWTPAVDTVTGDTTYTATYTPTRRTYTVTWKNGDTVLKTEQVEYGKMPVYSGADPTKEADAQYTYAFNGWDPEIKEVTGAATYTAVFTQNKKTYTLNWVNSKSEEGTRAEDVAWGTEIQEPQAPKAEGYDFAGWFVGEEQVQFPYTMPEENVTMTAHWTAKLYTITWVVDGVGTTTQAPYGQLPQFDGTPAKTGDAQYSYTFAGWDPALTEVTGDTIYTAQFTQSVNQYTVRWMNGEEVLATQTLDYGEVPAYNGTDPVKAETARYSYQFSGWDKEPVAITGDTDFQAQFTQVGKNGLCVEGEDTYWIKDGKNVQFPGLVRVQDENGNNLYYYFGEDDKAVKNVPLDGPDFWVEKTNDLLPQWGYHFDENGVIYHDDRFQNGICTENGAKYYYIDGIRVHMGMFKIGDDYYYAKSSGQLVVNASYYCERINDLVPEIGVYSFDAEGRLINKPEKNGIVAENGSLYYYVKGRLTYAGLIEIDGAYYYVKTNGEVVHGKNYWISKTNGLMPERSYRFDEDGKIQDPELIDLTKNGIVSEDGSLFYYVNGVKTYAGLIKIGSDYYYVKSDCEVVHGRSYWITKTNGLMGERSYRFDEDGKMIDPEIKEEGKNGIVAEDGTLYYYVDGVRTYAGLIEIDGDYYYVKTSGEVVHGRKYWISKTNGIVKEGSYEFASDGKMIR